ncbi:MAG: methyltransferase [Propionicimonas sp.]|nr:methyltransferase domain-containing protein [Propionicimonas sp.]
MTSVPRLTRLTFHGPLSGARADRLVARLSRTSPSSVLDVGCGWGELLLRVLAACPAARGVGVDINEADLARGKAAAEDRGLGDRVLFTRGDASAAEPSMADIVVCLGSSHALSEDLGEALAALRALVRPGGRVLLGEGFFCRPPTPVELAAMWPGASADDHPSLPGLVDTAVAAGFRPEWIETATRAEWEDFESGYLADVEEWLVANPDHAEAADTRAKADAHRRRWLRGYGDVLGQAYLTLIPT